MRNEPVVTANGIVALVTALLVLSVSFGLSLTDEQRAAIIGVVVIVAPLASAWWIRRQVTPLSAPRDEDGAPLTRMDNSPTIKARRLAQVK